MPGGPGTPGTLHNLGPLDRFLAAAEGAVGAPYVYGAEGPSSFDCSGLIQWAAGKAGFKGVPRTSEAQWGWVHRIQLNELQPGDLVFTQWPGDNTAPGHVQIYAGNGRLVGADNSHTGVEYSKLSDAAGHVVGYGRIPGQAASSGGSDLGGLVGGLGDILTGGAGTLLQLAIPQPVQDAFTGLQKLAEGLAWFINPENWARILAGGLGVILVAFGLFFLVRAGM